MLATTVCCGVWKHGNVSCKPCFNECTICAEHKGIYSTWVPDNRPCERCTELGLRCVRFRIPVTVSDEAPTYEKYGKLVSGTLEQLISGEKQGPFHIHDIGHMVKNAEASLERGTHFDGKYSYDSNDLVVVM